MTISLTAEQESKLQELIQKGQFESPEQFISYSLASLDEDEDTTAWLKAQVAKGLQSLDEGKRSSLSTEEIVAEAQKRLQTA